MVFYPLLVALLGYSLSLYKSYTVDTDLHFTNPETNSYLKFWLDKQKQTNAFLESCYTAKSAKGNPDDYGQNTSTF